MSVSGDSQNINIVDGNLVITNATKKIRTPKLEFNDGTDMTTTPLFNGSNITTNVIQVGGLYTSGQITGNGSALKGITFDSVVNQGNATSNGVSVGSLRIAGLESNGIPFVGTNNVLTTNVASLSFIPGINILHIDSIGGLDARVVVTGFYPQATAKGQPVYIQENINGSVHLHLAENDVSTYMPCVGLAMYDYAANSSGYAVTGGTLLDLNIPSTFIEGSLTGGSGGDIGKIIYISSTAGKMTITRPTDAPQLVQNIGIIAKVTGNKVDVLVQGSGRFEDNPNRLTSQTANVYQSMTIGSSTLYSSTNLYVAGNVFVQSQVGTSNAIVVSGNVSATYITANGKNLTHVTDATTGTYGSSSSIPVITIGSNGRMTSIASQAISTVATGVVGQVGYYSASGTISGDAGLTYDAGTDTLTVAGSVSALNMKADTSLTTLGNQAGRVSGSGAIAVGLSAGLTSQGVQAIAIGTLAGQSGQTANALAIGYQAGYTAQASNAVAVGTFAGSVSQDWGCVAIGNQAGYTGQIVSAVAIGHQAGYSTQGCTAVAIGYFAGSNTQGSASIAIGRLAGQSTQTSHAIAVGYAAGTSTQGCSSIAMGFNAGNTSQGLRAIAIGTSAGQIAQNAYSTAVGYYAGQSLQSSYAVAFGIEAGEISQGIYATAVGGFAGVSNQGSGAVALGVSAGESAQSASAISIGYQAGQLSQGQNAIAIGLFSGQYTQARQGTAVGYYAGYSAQSSFAVALGTYAGQSTQGLSAVAIGNQAGQSTQGCRSIAIGQQAGELSLGSHSIAIGYSTNVIHTNTTYLNASGAAVASLQNNALYVNPVRYLANTSLSTMRYSSSTKEMSQDINPSDERIKENIETANIQQCYDIVKNLELKRFQFKREAFNDEEVYDRRRLGWIAQEVNEVFPKSTGRFEFTMTDGTVIPDLMTLDTSQLYATTYGAVKKLIEKTENEFSGTGAINDPDVSCVVTVPGYIKPDAIIHVTPIFNGVARRMLNVSEPDVASNAFTVYGTSGKFYWTLKNTL
jgi:hypothetical protein